MITLSFFQVRSQVILIYILCSVFISLYTCVFSLETFRFILIICCNDLGFRPQIVKVMLWPFSCNALFYGNYLFSFIFSLGVLSIRIFVDVK